jgi:hypothetical protein
VLAAELSFDATLFGGRVREFESNSDAVAKFAWLSFR